MKKFKWRVRRRLLALSVALSISVAVLGELHAAPSNPTQVKIEAGSEGDPAEAEAYLAANASVVQTRLPEAVRKCAREASSTAVVDFELAIEVRKGGKPAKSAATPSNSFTRCVAEAVRTVTFTEPPHDPLGVHFEVSFTK